MASIATAASLSDLQISRQIENRLSKTDALENVTVSVQTSVGELERNRFYRGAAGTSVWWCL